MLRSFALGVLATAFWAVPVEAASWADEMFPVRQHDFGKVERGEKPSYDFVLVNPSNREARIRGVRVSCSCTKATAHSSRIPPGGGAVLTATMDTSGFQGSKSVTIHVEFDRPWRAEVVLRVNVESVGKLASEGTEVDFGLLPQGAAHQKKLNLDYLGPLDWRIVDLDFGNPQFSVEVTEVHREPGKVRYELVLGIRAETAGVHEDVVRVHTNDPAQPELIVKARAHVEADVVVSPSIVRLGGVKPGEVVERKVLIKAAQPFKVVRVDNADDLFQVKATEGAKTTHLVVLTLTAPADDQEIPAHVDIVTDLGGERVISVDIAK
jgi:hypothetical protein